jgi:hypothetical protein
LGFHQLDPYVHVVPEGAERDKGRINISENNAWQLKSEALTLHSITAEKKKEKKKKKQAQKLPHMMK